MSEIEDNVPVEERVGPSGYVGEYKYTVQLEDGMLFSLLSGMHTLPSEMIVWDSLPKFYKNIAIEMGDVTWIPKIVHSPEIGIVFVDVDENDDWYWVAMKSGKDEKGEWITDNKTTKTFTKIQYLDALEYVGLVDTPPAADE